MSSHTTIRSISLALALPGTSAAQAQIGCDRACLTGIVDAWFDGLHANTVTGLPLANDV